MSEDEVIDRLRAEMIGKIVAALRTTAPLTPEDQHARVEALLYTAATIFCAHNRVPYRRGTIDAVTAAALSGMLDWLEGYKTRN